MGVDSACELSIYSLYSSMLLSDHDSLPVLSLRCEALPLLPAFPLPLLKAASLVGICCCTPTALCCWLVVLNRCSGTSVFRGRVEDPVSRRSITSGRSGKSAGATDRLERTRGFWGKGRSDTLLELLRPEDKRSSPFRLPDIGATWRR